MINGRILEYFEYLRNLDKRLVLSSNFDQIVFLVELVYNIINNQEILMTPKDKSVLLQQKELLMLISKSRQEKEARILLKHLTPSTLLALQRIIFHTVFQETL